MPCPKEQPRNQILNFWAIASLQVAWKLLEGRYLVFCIKKYLIWSQALCLAHSFLSLSPHCWIGCCSSFEMQRLVNVWLSGGKFFLVVDFSLKPDWLLRVMFQLCEELYDSLLPFSSCTQQILKACFAPDAVCGTNRPEIRGGSLSALLCCF